MSTSSSPYRAVKHSALCAEGLVIRRPCEGFPHCYVPACAVCGGDLPTFPAFIVKGDLITGPFCDEHAVLTVDNEGAERA